jgi:dolichol kinase
MTSEVRRKLIHAATGIAAAPWVLFVPEPAATLGLAAALLAVLALEIGRLRRPGLAAALNRALPGVFRPAEAGRLSGAFLLILGYTLASACFGARAAAAGILALAAGDAAAALAGRAWARSRPQEGNGRTFAGSLACFAAAAGVVALVVPWSAGIVVAAALAAAALERWDPWGLDNVLVPVGVGLVVELLLRKGL